MAGDIGAPDATPMLEILSESGILVIRCPFDTAFLHTGQRDTRSASKRFWDEDDDKDEDDEGDEENEDGDD